MEKAKIYSLSFDGNGEWIICSSNSKTIHLFSVTESEENSFKDDEIKRSKSNSLTEGTKNPKSR